MWYQARIACSLYHHRSECCRGRGHQQMASEIAEDVPSSDSAEASDSTSEWYEHLKPRGSCVRLHDLLKEKRDLIHQLGPKGITVLHKGVQHGYVGLVKFILVDMFDDEGYCTCGVCVSGDSRLTREQLLRKACKDDITAVQMTMVSGSPKMVLLLNWAIDKNKLEVKQKHQSSKGDKVSAPSDATRVRIRRVQHVSTGNAVWFSGEKWHMEGDRGSKSSNVFRASTKRRRRKRVTDTESDNVQVPDVKDDTIDCVYDTNSEEVDMIPKVYDIIERLLEDPDCFGPGIQEKIQRWKDECKKHVDFEFVPVAHVFLHFLFSTERKWTSYKIREFRFRDTQPYTHPYTQLYTQPAYVEAFEKIIRACNEHDREERGGGSMVATLFKILDPRGRTILHAAHHYAHSILDILVSMDRMDLNEVSIELMKKCINSTDGAGRTVLHFMCSDNVKSPMDDQVMIKVDFQKWNVKFWNWNAKLSPLCGEELKTLQEWCFPWLKEAWVDYRPIHLAILFDKTELFKYFYLKCEGQNTLFVYRGNEEHVRVSFTPLQLAAFLGRSAIIEEILMQAKLKPFKDSGYFTFDDQSYHPAIHCAALSSQVEALQSILKYPVYDPFIQHGEDGTALHLALKRKNFNKYVRSLQSVAFLHMLPNSELYARLKYEFSKLYFDEHKPKMFSANESSCINLLLQGGIDVWTPHFKTGESPRPGQMADDKAREWWYYRVANEVVIQKTSINNASNATSVIATLVATASFIGPLQPPLGLADDGFMHTSASAVRVYFVCNGLSFYFSIASILMAVLPAIPMPKESLYDELFRSQRCLKTASMFLLVAITCLLTSFTSASLAVVSSKQHDIQLVGAYVGIGGLVCIFVLVVYIIRMLRMVFHKNNRFRRWFANNMVF